MPFLTFFELPEDILDYIYDLSGNQANYKKTMQKQLKFRYSMKILDSLQNKCFTVNNMYKRYFGYRHMFVIVIHNCCKDELEKIQLFNGLKNCDCCYRHNDNVPNNITDSWDENINYYGLKENDNDKKATNSCSCKCRHYKRLLSSTVKRDNYISGYFDYVTG